MIEEEAAAVLIAILVVAGIFTFSQLTYQEKYVVEPFSGLSVLDYKGMMKEYPRTVSVNSTFKLNLFVKNYEGHTVYYVVYVKLGDIDTVVNASKTAEAPIIAVYQFILPHGYNRTIPIELSLNRPIVNGKLIFEMWAVDPRTLALTYKGIWCQLKINATLST